MEAGKNVFFGVCRKTRGASLGLTRGFSLVEVSMVIVVISLISVGIFGVYIGSQRVYQKGETKVELSQNGRVVSERIAREIRQALEIVSSLPQLPDNAPSAIEFQDGHTPSPYDYLGSDFYYIRYYVASTSSVPEIHRQYRVYCFEPCGSCSSYVRWNDTIIQGGQPVTAHACDLENRIVAEYVKDLKFWGTDLVSIQLVLSKGRETVELKTNVFCRNF